MARKKLNIGLFGYGTVAKGFVAALKQSKGIDAQIVKIAVRDLNKSRDLPKDLFTTDHNKILKDQAIDVIVELTDDADVALGVIAEALKQGKAVITANKKVVATHFAYLRDLQLKYQRPILYEAAACGSIPIIRNLEEYYDNELLKGIEGILNGSSNYVLSKVFREGYEIADALTEAFQEGYLESDPSLDLDGHDAAYKLSILIAHAFGTIVPPTAIPRFGISRLGNPELRFAKENNYRLRLVAKGALVNGEVVAWVLPQFVASDHRLYSVENEYNAIVLEGQFLEGQMLLGKGAGSYPTGSAVLSDLSALTYDYAYEYRKLARLNAQELPANTNLKIYFRYADAAVLNAIDFEEIQESFRAQTYSYLVAKIKLHSLIQFLNGSATKDVFISLLPENTSDSKEAKPEESLHFCLNF